MKNLFGCLISGLLLFSSGCSLLGPGPVVEPEPTVTPDKEYTTYTMECNEPRLLEFTRAELPPKGGEMEVTTSTGSVLGKINLAAGEKLSVYFTISPWPLDMDKSNIVVDLRKCDYIKLSMDYDSALTGADLKITLQTVTGDWYFNFKKSILPVNEEFYNFITIRALFKDFLPADESNKEPINLSQVTGGRFDVSAGDDPVTCRLNINWLTFSCLPDFYEDLSFVKAPGGLRLDSLPYQEIYQLSDKAPFLGNYFGYGLYGDTTNIAVDNEVLDIQYRVRKGQGSRYHNSGWASVRREFKDLLLDASGDSGISFELKVDTAADKAILSFSLCDVIFPEDVRTPWKDELLGCDLQEELKTTSDWHTIKIPFSNFKHWQYLNPPMVLSMDYMQWRCNDRCLLKERIRGYEISVLDNTYSRMPTFGIDEFSTAKNQGAFSIRNIRTY